MPTQEVESDIEDKVENKVEGSAYTLEVGSLACALKDKRAKQTSV
jgi:hypothetical protein